jgi:hypothetical protein
VPVCLAGGIRSQSFSLSQRFDPSETSWLCFKPHPPIGFGPSELFPYDQPPPLSGRRALLSSNLPVADRSGQANRSSDFRAFIRPHVRHSPKALSRSTSRCSPGLSPLRGLPVPAAGENASPLTLHARNHAAKTTRPRALRHRVSTTKPGNDYESRSNLHEVCHLVRLAGQCASAFYGRIAGTRLPCWTCLPTVARRFALPDG